MKAIHLVALGNPAMSDDGAGPRIAEQFKQINWPGRVVVHNTATASLTYRRFLKEDNHIFILDALQAGHPPGTVIKLSAAGLRLDGDIFSLHDMHLLHLVCRFYRHRLPHIRVYGIEPASLSPGTNLSPPVKSGLPLLARVLARDILRLSRQSCKQSKPAPIL